MSHWQKFFQIILNVCSIRPSGPAPMFGLPSPTLSLAAPLLLSHKKYKNIQVKKKKKIKVTQKLHSFYQLLFASFCCLLFYYEIRNFIFENLNLSFKFFFLGGICCHHHHLLLLYLGYALLVPFSVFIQGKWGRLHPKKLRISYVVPTLHRIIEKL